MPPGVAQSPPSKGHLHERENSFHRQHPHHRRPRGRRPQRRWLRGRQAARAAPGRGESLRVAWSACYLGALGLAATRKHIKLPPDAAVDAEIKLNLDGGEFFLSARLDVSLPGLDPAEAEELAHAAHGICPYSKATHGNIAVETRIV
jgi:organic hydroperoxide reductase OsmC/OhrA